MASNDRQAAAKSRFPRKERNVGTHHAGPRNRMSGLTAQGERSRVSRSKAREELPILVAGFLQPVRFLSVRPDLRQDDIHESAPPPS